MTDLNELNFEKVLLSSADSKKIEMVSNAINLIIGQSKKIPKPVLLFITSKIDIRINLDRKE